MAKRQQSHGHNDRLQTISTQSELKKGSIHTAFVETINTFDETHGESMKVPQKEPTKRKLAKRADIEQPIPCDTSTDNEYIRPYSNSSKRYRKDGTS